MTQVKLTTQTYDILRNYSLINSSILIRKGSVIKTISVGENIVSEYKCEEVWPQTFGIYDLPQFLMAVSLFQDPILEFNNNSYLTIRGNGGNTCKYFFSSPDITLKAAPERDVQFPGADIEFNVATNTLTKIQRAANNLNTPDLSFISDPNGHILLRTCDKEDETCNVYEENLKGNCVDSLDLSMKIENLRLYDVMTSSSASSSTSYTAKVSSKLITQWEHSVLDLKYYIALEP